MTGTALDADAIGARVVAAFATVEARRSGNGQPFLLVPPALIDAVCRWLRDEPALRFDAVMDLTGYDQLKYPATPARTSIAVVYLLFSYVHRHKLMLIVAAEREACTVPTVSTIWPAAIYFEREVYDLLGVTFAGHPSLERIMCPDDWVGHPLRKDYVHPADYHGVPHLRDGQHFVTSPPRHGQPPPAPPSAPGKHA